MEFSDLKIGAMYKDRFLNLFCFCGFRGVDKAEMQLMKFDDELGNFYSTDIHVFMNDYDVFLLELF